MTQKAPKAPTSLRELFTGLYAEEMVAGLLQSLGVPKHLIDQARKTHGSPPSGFTTAQLASILHQTAAANIPREIRAGYATVNVPKDEQPRGKVVKADPFNVTGMYDHAIGNTGMYFSTGKKPSTGVQTDDPMTTQVGGNHYKDMKIQPVEYAEANKLSPTEFAIVKYVSRHKSKGGAEDVEKIIHFAEMLLKLQYGVTLPPRVSISKQESDWQEAYDKGYEAGRYDSYVETEQQERGEDSSSLNSTSPPEATTVQSNGEAPNKRPCPNCGSLDCPGSIEKGSLPLWFVYPEMPSNYLLMTTEIYRVRKPHPETGRHAEYVILDYRRPNGDQLLLVGLVAYDSRIEYFVQPMTKEIDWFVDGQFKPGKFRRSNSYTPNRPAIIWFDNV